jgi:hypothetical protein
MLLAATETFAWRRQDKETIVETVATMPSPVPVEEDSKEPEQEAPEEPEPDQSDTDGPADEEPGETRSEDKFDGGETDIDTEEPIQDPRPLERTLHVEHIVLPPHDEPEYIPNPEIEEEEVVTKVDANDGRQDEPVDIEEPTEQEIQAVEEDIFAWKEEDENDPSKRAKRIWKRLNPDDTMKRQEQMLAHGEISELPWEQYIDQSDEKLEEFASSSFGSGNFPSHAIKGDTFIKTDVLPSTLHKFNGSKWIEIDKDATDAFAYNEEYIQHLIIKLGTGEYDPELLNDAERSAIEEQLKKGDL